MRTVVCGIAFKERFSIEGEGVFMRRLFSCCASLALAIGGFAGVARAQFKNGGQAVELRLPTISQRAIGTQRIGLTDITVNYCRPLVGGREIWGKAVPYGPVWRSGANENTTISFTDDVSVEGRALPAGTYGLHTIPTADQWTIIFSKNSTSWGSFSYDEKEDALRVTVKPHAAEFVEALAYSFDDPKPDSVAVTLRWEKLLGKSMILEAQGKKQEAEATKTKALDIANGLQLHFYGRSLQQQKKQDEGFAIFKVNVKKHPNEWYAHGELARMASAKGDFDTASKEMKLALPSAPDVAKPGIQRMIARLEKKEDINP